MTRKLQISHPLSSRPKAKKADAEAALEVRPVGLQKLKKVMELALSKARFFSVWPCLNFRDYWR